MPKFLHQFPCIASNLPHQASSPTPLYPGSLSSEIQCSGVFNWSVITFVFFFVSIQVRPSFVFTPHPQLISSRRLPYSFIQGWWATQFDNIPLCMYTALLNPFSCSCTFELYSYVGYCTKYSSEHRCTCICLLWGHTYPVLLRYHFWWVQGTTWGTWDWTLISILVSTLPPILSLVPLSMLILLSLPLLSLWWIGITYTPGYDAHLFSVVLAKGTHQVIVLTHSAMILAEGYISLVVPFVLVLIPGVFFVVPGLN